MDYCGQSSRRLCGIDFERASESRLLGLSLKRCLGEGRTGGAGYGEE